MPVVYDDIKDDNSEAQLKVDKTDEYIAEQEVAKVKPLEPQKINSPETVGEHGERIVWRRGFARLIDAFFELCFLGYLYSILFLSSPSSEPDHLQPALSSPVPTTTYTPVNYWTVWSFFPTIIALVAGILLIDSFVYTFFGNTFAKWVFSFQVKDKQGEKVSFGTYFLRNIYILLGGYFIPPPFCFIYLDKEEKRLRQGQETSYDEKLELHFIHYRVSWWMALLKFLVLVGVTILLCYLLTKI